MVHFSNKAINFRDDLIKANPDQFEGIEKFPGTYHIYSPIYENGYQTVTEIIM